MVSKDLIFVLITCLNFELMMAGKLSFNPIIPSTLLKSKLYVFKISLNNSQNNNDNHEFFHHEQKSIPSFNGVKIIKNILKINTKNVSTGQYKFEIYKHLENQKPTDLSVIEFFIVDVEDVRPNIETIYFALNKFSIIFHLNLLPKGIKLTDFEIKLQYDENKFYYKNDTMFTIYSVLQKNVYKINIDINYIGLSKRISIGQWITYVFFSEHKDESISQSENLAKSDHIRSIDFNERIFDEFNSNLTGSNMDYMNLRNRNREKMTDLEMDSKIIFTRMQVDYSEERFKEFLPKLPFMPAIPIGEYTYISLSKDDFNDGQLFLKFPAIFGFVWYLTFILLFILTVLCGKCQNYFWVPINRNFVRLNPYEGPKKNEMCNFEYWLSIVGHDKDRRPCFAEIWEDTFDEVFPSGICCNCLRYSARLIFEDRLSELVSFNNLLICSDTECRFPFFQSHLKIHNDRIPGFQCENCSKEAFITILKWAE